MSCSLPDKFESSHYRKFDLTKAVRIDSIVGNRFYVSDFLPSHNAYYIIDFQGEIGDTIIFRDNQERIIDFKYIKNE